METTDAIECPVDKLKQTKTSSYFFDNVNTFFSRAIITFGYMETPNVPRALALANKLGWKFDIMSTSFFLSRCTLIPSAKGGMPFRQDRIFIALA